MSIDCNVTNAPKFADWITNRGGIATWKSADLSCAGKTWSAPYLETDGSVKAKESWQMESKPASVTTDPAEVDIYECTEVNRFPIAIQRGRADFSMRLTDGSTRKVEAAVEKAGDGAYYEFDYDSQEAVIMTSKVTMTLKEWMEKNKETT